MSTTGITFPTSGTTQDRAGATAWTNPGNITADDTSYATAAVPTDYLIATGFGFSIPTGATIDGVTVRVDASETGAGNSSYIPQLVSAATPTLIGSAKSAVTVNNTSQVTSTDGGSSDLWGATLTPAICNAAGFGVAIWSTDATNTLSIDFITVEVTYTLALTVADGAHGHAADALTLTASSQLAAADGAHGHASDNLVLTSSTALTVADATHAHDAEQGEVAPTSPALPALRPEAVIVTSRGKAVVSRRSSGAAPATWRARPDLLIYTSRGRGVVSRRATGGISSTTLTVADATHAHAADAPVLTSEETLTVAAALHGHAVDSLALGIGLELELSGAAHGHTADGLDLSAAALLAVADALHAHTAAAIALETEGSVGAAAVWGHYLSNGKTAEQTLLENNEMLRIIMAAVAGKTAGVGTDTETYYGTDGTTPRVVATFDAQGNRLTVVTDGTP